MTNRKDILDPERVKMEQEERAWMDESYICPYCMSHVNHPKNASFHRNKVCSMNDL